MRKKKKCYFTPIVITKKLCSNSWREREIINTKNKKKNLRLSALEHMRIYDDDDQSEGRRSRNKKNKTKKNTSGSYQ